MNIEGFDFEICCFTFLFIFVGKMWCFKVVDTSESKAQYLSVSIQFLRMNSLVQLQYLSWTKKQTISGANTCERYTPTHPQTYIHIWMWSELSSYRMFSLRCEILLANYILVWSFHSDTRPDNILLFWSGDKVKFIIDIQFPFFFSSEAHSFYAHEHHSAVTLCKMNAIRLCEIMSTACECMQCIVP